MKKIRNKKKKQIDLTILAFEMFIGLFLISSGILAGLYGIENMINYRSIKELSFWGLISIIIFWKSGEVIKELSSKINDLFMRRLK